MRDEVTIMRLIQGDRIEVFNYFTQATLLEKWAFPDGMTLRIPLLEAKIGGSYRWEHRSKNGVFVCEGAFNDFQPGSKISQVERIIGPDGKILFPRMESTITFSEKPGGTFVTIVQRGFPDETSMKECEEGWEQCLNNLDNLFAGQDQKLKTA